MQENKYLLGIYLYQVFISIRNLVETFYGNPNSTLFTFPGGSDGKECDCNIGDPGSIPELGRSPEERMAIHSSILD